MSRFLPLLLLAPALAAQAPLGTWTLAKAPDLDAAVEAAVKETSFLIRPIARGRLKKTNPAYQRVVIERKEDTFVVTFDARKPQRMPASGAVVKWTREDGETFDLSMRLQGEDLVQTYHTHDGQRTNVYHVDPATRTLTINVTVSSGKLPKPLVYALAYKAAP
ncbi:hypothetical protein [Mesoterricola sediminis]|uniref:Lipocalin-like domain-containing protein n=1 Tax=Mesoterricola sediminis TaxID=2927980 RepID=A0AA48HD68_9BACT|nr:hypothetical protein [Mesoterricola sediminis]BDU76098.1 hypothetical protein METESE_10560 [Mesoterricola sediminis]